MDKVNPPITCAHCSPTMNRQDSIPKHYKLAHKGKTLEQRINTYNFEGFTTEKKVQFYHVVKTLPRFSKELSHQSLITEYEQLKKEFKQARTYFGD